MTSPEALRRIDCAKPAWVSPPEFDTFVEEDSDRLASPGDVRLLRDVSIRYTGINYNEFGPEDRASVNHFKRRMRRCAPVDPPTLTVWDPPTDPAAPAGVRVHYDGAHRGEAARELGIARTPLAVVFADEGTGQPHAPPPDWHERTTELLRQIYHDSSEEIEKLRRANRELRRERGSE